MQAAGAMQGANAGWAGSAPDPSLTLLHPTHLTHPMVSVLSAHPVVSPPVLAVDFLPPPMAQGGAAERMQYRDPVQTLAERILVQSASASTPPAASVSASSPAEAVSAVARGQRAPRAASVARGPGPVVRFKAISTFKPNGKFSLEI